MLSEKTGSGRNGSLFLRITALNCDRLLREGGGNKGIGENEGFGWRTHVKEKRAA